MIIDGRYISDHYPGIGRYVYNLVAALSTMSRELPITLLVDAHGPQTRFDLHGLGTNGIELIPMSAPLRSLRGRGDGVRACRARAPILFHAPHVLSAIPSRWPSVVTIHDLIPTGASEGRLSMPGRVIFRTLLRRSLAASAAIITPSTLVSSELQERWGVPAERITVTPLAADPNFRPAAPARVAADRMRLGLPERYVVCVASNRPHKNLQRLVEAWGLDEARRHGCRLLVAGPIDARYPEVVRRARALGEDRVSLLGQVPEADLPSVYRGARVVVHPALHEGFGLPIIEAMASGVPVACSGSRTLDDVCGAAALRFDPTSAVDISRVIGRLLNDDRLRDELIIAGLARAAQLTWTHTAELTLAAYRSAQRRERSGVRPG